MEDPTNHGLVVVGFDTLYASHMPRFVPPFDYQVVCEIELDNDVYRSMREKYGTSAQFTLRTEPLTLADLRAGDDGRPVLKSFGGELFLGRFGRDGDSMGSVTVEVRRTL